MAVAPRQRAAVGAGLRAFLRKPMNVALLVALPPAVIFMYELAVDPISAAPGIDLTPGAADLGGALFATAFLAGLLGLFQVVGTAQSDRRLVVCGYHPAEVLLARLLTVLIAGGLVAGITFVTFWVRTDVTPARPLVAFGALLGAALVYALVGVCLGALFGRELEGSLVLVFLADIDSFGSIGVVPTESAVLDYFPLATPHDMLHEAVYGGTVSGGDVATVLGYAGALAVLGVVLVAHGGDLT
ncbi:ABC-2 family transporter protein [Halovenus aranensis]|uniref:ABC-2 family transporter protein n=1 Tax=Halovenus aranensis TaxID=890420 RepID=A0A1G8S9C3_9EURY|nr:ABC transporter permease [Halovenus aranensis]SDJ25280.1 ABC-2 family transporter protein [Halovenus aranensis]